jgi:hypothetical protein
VAARGLRIPALLALVLALTIGCTQERRDEIRDQVSDRASGSSLPTGLPSSALPTPEESTTEPATSEPATSEPATSEPATSEPATSEPATSDPATSAPATSDSSAAAVDSPSPSATTDDKVDQASDGGSTSWWWLALALVLLLAALIAWLVGRSRRRTAAWERRTHEALDRSSELATHLSAAEPMALTVVAAQDSSQLSSLAAELDDLAENSKDPGQSEALRLVRGQVGALHGVVDGIALSGEASPAAVAHLREQAAAVHAAAGQARARIFPPPPAPSS